MKNKYYYALRKLNSEVKPEQEFTKYIYIHNSLGWQDRQTDIRAAILFNSKDEAEKYKITHDKAKDYEVFEVDPRKICLSTISCDDCSWEGICPRHQNG